MKTFLCALFASLCILQAPHVLADDQGPGVLEFDTPATQGTAPVGPALAAPSGFVGHLPAARSTQAPDWVKPGTRITIWGGSATYMGGGNMTTMVSDPNGNLVDANGNRYRKTTAGGGNGTSAGAGAGFTQVDVTSVSSNAVTLDVRTYGGDGTTMAPQIMSVVSLVVHPGSCEFWIHPALLGQIAPGKYGIVNVLKGKWEVQGRHYDSIVFQQGDSSGNSHAVFDLKTGVALGISQLTRSTSNHTQYDPNAQTGTPTTSNNKTMIETYLASVRQVSYPWAGAPLPSNSMPTTSFRGQMGMEPSYGVPGNPMSAVVRMGRQGNGWFESLVEVQFGQGGPGSKNTVSQITTSAQLGGYLMSPQALARLQQGQQIDQDPVTGARTYIEYVGPSNTGQPIVGIVEETRGGMLRWIYDARSGYLHASAMVTYLPEGMGSSTIYLERTGQ